MEGAGKKFPLKMLRRSLNGAELKWIAAITMFIDHSAVMFFLTWLIPLRRAARIIPFLAPWEHKLYWFLRHVGRPAFPIFCFLLVEGFFHTRDVKKYLGRLLVFALISELPFDYALSGRINWYYQNVCFTLFLGLLGVWGIRWICGEDLSQQSRRVQLMRILGSAAVALGCMAAARVIYCDYEWTGVAVILLFFLLRKWPLLRDTAAGLTLLNVGKIEASAWVVIPLFRLYNGQRGRQPKYFFYVFYPGHLALLWLLRYLATGS